MLKINILLLFIFFAQSSKATVAEDNFRFAYQNIEKFMVLCLNDDECNLDDSQKILLQKITSTINEEKINSKQLIFASAVKNPGLFLIDGQIKIAKTYDSVASNIYINNDMTTSQGSAMQVKDAVAILIHELGHHHNVIEEMPLDLLGLKVAFYYQQKFLQETYNDSVLNLKVSAYNYWLKVSLGSVFRSKAHFDLIISDENSFEVLTTNFQTFNCAQNKPQTTVCDNKPEMVASNLQNLTWNDSQNMTGNVTFICRCSDNSLTTLFSAKKKFSLNVILKNNTYQKNSASIRILP